MKTKLLPNEYQSFKEFFRFFFEKYFPRALLTPEQHPIAVLETLEISSLSKARKGLEMALRDCVEMTNDWSPDQISAADADLNKNGLILLTELRDRFSRKRTSKSEQSGTDPE